MLAQPQTVFYRAWARTSATLEEDFTNHVATLAAPSGETFVAGSTKNAGGTYSMLLSKYQVSGLLAWETEFTVNDTGNVHVGSIALDASGNILVVGSAYNGATNGYDLLLVKFDDSGNEIWHRFHNGPANSYDFGAAVACDATNDDVYVTGGAFATFLDMDAVVIRYDSSGAVQWAETWDNDGLTDACGTIALVGGMAIATGFTQTDAVTWEYAALRFDTDDGDLLGAFVTNQSGTTIEQVTAVAFDDADNIYITGALGGSLTNLDIKTVKLDADLNIQWTATWNGTANRDDVGRGIAVDDAGNVYVAGHTTNGDDTRDALLLKYSSSGTLIWAETHDAEGGHDEFADVALTDDGMPFVGGYVTQHGNKDFYAALYDTSGTRVWSDWYNGRHNDDDEAVQITSDGLGNFLLAGPSTRPSGREVLTLKYARHTLVLPSDEGVSAPFVENRGQVLNTDLEPEDDIRYYTRQMYPNVYIFDNQLSYVFAHVDTVPTSTDTMARIDLTFTGLQPNREGVAVGLERQDYHHNYYLGHIPEGRERVALENKVLQPSIYQNIDALYGQGPDGLFIRLICQPGSDPSEIRLQFAGHTGIWVDTATGALVLETALESLVLPAPEAMTIDDEGVETEITAWQPAYVVDTGGVVSITTGSYDTSGTLVVKVGRGREEEEAPCNQYWSTYFGDVGTETVLGSDTDANGDMYFTGKTTSADFPNTNGVYQEQLRGKVDAFAACFKQFDEQRWLTFYGGSQDGSPFNYAETGHAIKHKDLVGTTEDLIYFVGRTCAPDFPLALELPGEYHNTNLYDNNPPTWNSRGFIVKLTSDNGFQKWATFFGDAHRKTDAVVALEILSNGNIAVGGCSFTKGGYTTSDFPIVAPSPSAHTQTTGAAYVAEFDGDNKLVWSTRLTYEDNNPVWLYPNSVHDISEDGNGNLFLTGITNDDRTNDFIPFGSNTFAFKGLRDIFVMKFNGSRDLTWSTFFGGEGDDWPNTIACLNNGDVILTGTTQSTQNDAFPVKAVGDPSNLLLNDLSYNGGYSDIFIARFANTGAHLWARYFGGPGEDKQGYLSFPELIGTQMGAGNGATIKSDGTIYLTGSVQNGFQPIASGNSCRYYYPEINGFQSTSDFGYTPDGRDAIIVAMNPSQAVTFSTYWGGSSGNPTENFDFGFAIATGTVPATGKHFVLIGGVTNSGIVIPDGKRTIPVCHESSPPVPFYYIPDLVGQSDAFISKIYLDECFTVGTAEQDIEYPKLKAMPVPAESTVLLFAPFEHSGQANLRVFDATGRDVTSLIDLSTGSSQISLGIRRHPQVSTVFGCKKAVVWLSANSSKYKFSLSLGVVWAALPEQPLMLYYLP